MGFKAHQITARHAAVRKLLSNPEIKAKYDEYYSEKLKELSTSTASTPAEVQKAEGGQPTGSTQ